MNYRLLSRSIFWFGLVLVVVVTVLILEQAYRRSDYWPIALICIFCFIVVAGKVVRHTQEHRYSVNVSPLEVTCVRSDGERELVLWDELQSVSAEGAFVGGYILLLNGARSGCVVPGSAEGIEILLKRQEELPGFDWDAITAAATSEEAEWYNCCERPS
ncbi:MAG: hypothetical protein ND895_08760 [Pyrinomonadaceae bacterium]|nr:hypothetical protein [Pyrinomonadaceae bacterium]